MPHRPAVRESVERIKVKITYDASSKPAKYAASLNDFLEKVLLFKIQCGIVRSRFKAILLYVDTRKALL